VTRPTPPEFSATDGEQRPDRVTDWAANRVPASLITMRDWLLVALAFSAGMYDAIAFFGFGKVMAAFQSGNIVLLGAGIEGVRPPAGPVPLRVVVSLVAFAIGAIVAVRILKAFDGEEELEDNEVSVAWPRRVTIALATVFVIQLVFFGVWVTQPEAPSDTMVAVLVGINAFGMGLQMNAIRSMHVPGVSSTAATATFINIFTGLAGGTLTRHQVRRWVGSVVAMSAGALLATWLLHHAHAYAPVVPVAIIGLVIVIAKASLSERPSLHPQVSPAEHGAL
jgi:uncharacterized membrane protein YoaK (UPF0700 family)